MTLLNPEKIKRFKDRLFKNRASLLMQKGDGSLNPIPTCRTDEDGEIIISTDKIIEFFFNATGPEESLRTDEHFANLYTLFEVFTREIKGYTFESDLKISEKAIHEANTKTTIESLTKNLIISYFDNIRVEDTNEIDRDLLDRNFTKLIRISSQGRDYRTLVSNTLEELSEALKNDDSWRKCIRNMNDAALVCTLVGARLPKIESGVVSGFIRESREELQQINLMLTRILNTKAGLTKEEINLKNYLKTVKKLELATGQVLDKMDEYFFYAHNFMELLDIPMEKFIDKENDILMENLARTFLGYPGRSAGEENFPEPDINHSSIRFRMDQLFRYPELITCCKMFKDHEIYHDYYKHIFKCYYREMADLIDKMINRSGRLKISRLGSCVFELKKIMKAMEPDQGLLTEEKDLVREQYISLTGTVDTDQLDEIIRLLEDIRFITNDLEGRFFEKARKKLVTACYDHLKAIEHRTMKPDEFKSEFQKTLFGYAHNYKPQRQFYKTFFETYVGQPGEPVKGSFQEMITTNKPFALMMLKALSDTKALGQLLPEKHLEHASGLFETHCPPAAV